MLAVFYIFDQAKKIRAVPRTSLVTGVIFLTN